MGKTYKLHCAIDGKEINSIRSDAKTCSHQCRTDLAMKKRRAFKGQAEATFNYYCVICRSQFDTPRHDQITCSPACTAARYALLHPGMKDENARKLSIEEQDECDERILEVMGETAPEGLVARMAKRNRRKEVEKYLETDQPPQPAT